MSRGRALLRQQRNYRRETPEQRNNTLRDGFPMFVCAGVCVLVCATVCGCKCVCVCVDEIRAGGCMCVCVRALFPCRIERSLRPPPTVNWYWQGGWPIPDAMGAPVTHRGRSRVRAREFPVPKATSGHSRFSRSSQWVRVCCCNSV